MENCVAGDGMAEGEAKPLFSLHLPETGSSKQLVVMGSETFSVSSSGRLLPRAPTVSVVLAGQQ